jgi:hypothetical protein
MPTIGILLAPNATTNYMSDIESISSRGFGLASQASLRGTIALHSPSNVGHINLLEPPFILAHIKYLFYN